MVVRQIGYPPFNIESGQKQRISNRLGNITCIEQINSEHFL